MWHGVHQDTRRNASFVAYCLKVQAHTVPDCQCPSDAASASASGPPGTVALTTWMFKLPVCQWRALLLRIMPEPGATSSAAREADGCRTTGMTRAVTPGPGGAY